VDTQGHHFDMTPTGRCCRWCGLTITGRPDAGVSIAVTSTTIAASLAPCEPLAL